ncbi:MAG: hypothetical protein QXE06_08220 [Candidatus Bathyarchaeia archaeon]
MALKTQVKALTEKIEKLESIVNVLISRPSLQIDKKGRSRRETSGKVA